MRSFAPRPLMLLLALVLLFTLAPVIYAASLSSVNFRWSANYGGSVIADRLVSGSYHWLTSREIAPNPRGLGTWRWSVTGNAQSHYAVTGMAVGDVVEVGLGASDSDPGIGDALYSAPGTQIYRIERRADGTIAWRYDRTIGVMPLYAFVVYDGANYAGSWCYSSVPETANIHSSCDNRVSSIHLQAGWSVRVFSEQGQRGASACLTASDPNLADNLFEDGSSLDNTISSFVLTSRPACDAPPTGQAPAAPGGPVATAVSQNSVTMSWRDTSNNEDSFTIYRASDTGGAWLAVGTVAANVTSFTATGLACNTRSFFTMQARNAYGATFAPPSSRLEVTTRACAQTTTPPLIFVPGIAGSQLYQLGFRIWP